MLSTQLNIRPFSSSYVVLSFDMTTSKHHLNLAPTDYTKNLNFSLAQKNKQRGEVEDDHGGNEQYMFNSQFVLSSKGPLNSIWVAGYFFKRLKKSQIIDTDITFSVDKILLYGLPSAKYRILAYLVLGVARIYSKKVEYLHQDCGRIVSEINKFSLGKTRTSFRDIVRPTNSISLPESYELDAFQLEVADTPSRDHTIGKKDVINLGIVLAKETGQCSLDKLRFEEPLLDWEELDDFLTSVGLSEQQKIQTPEKVATDQETTTPAHHTPPENVISPLDQTVVNMEVSPPDCTEKPEISKEKPREPRELRFTRDDRMDIDMICDVDVELFDLINDFEELDTAAERDKDDLQEAPRQEDKADPSLVEQASMQEDKADPSLVEQASMQEVSDVSATLKLDVVPTPTPAKKKKLLRLSKKRCIFDENTMLDNEEMKSSIKDASTLVCKRRKVPRTVIGMWRLDRVPGLIKNFKEPLIHCTAMELDYTHCRKETNALRSVSAAGEPDVSIQVPEKLKVPVSPRTSWDNQTALAPETPVALAPETPVRASRLFERATAEDSEGEGAHLLGHTENNLSAHEEEVPAPTLLDETDVNEGDSEEIHKQKNGWSGRTRTVATYLHEVHQKKLQKGERAVPLLPILEHKSKAESARFFYEILVLSSGGFINITQQKPYEDLLVQETSKLEETLQNS